MVRWEIVEVEGFVDFERDESLVRALRGFVEIIIGGRGGLLGILVVARVKLKWKLQIEVHGT